MSGHFPFSGKANRVGMFAFYEKNCLNLKLQEKYYRWWYEWAKAFVLNDADLRVLKADDFTRFPYGQHALHDFHLHKFYWCTTMIDIGKFIDAVILSKLGADALHRLDEEHRRFVESLREEAKQYPREPIRDIGYFRHT
ncbi:MAG: hypothetical protein ACREUA_02625 [Burkholderiales bacterium]